MKTMRVWWPGGGGLLKALFGVSTYELWNAFILGIRPLHHPKDPFVTILRNPFSAD